MKYSLLLTIALLFIQSIGHSQATIGDCLGAIPVCDQIYVETQSPIGPGNFQEISPDFNCMQTELNSVWYSFTVNQSGNFGFLLTPNDPDDDYDWSLFDITNATCEDLFNDPSLIVSCNAAGGTGCHGPTGANGDSEFDIQGFGCFGTPPFLGNNPFNALVPVEAGNTYVLCVSNWTGSPNGYTLDFGISADIGIFDETPPFVELVEAPEDCSDNTITVAFSEPIQCSTIDGSDFTITGPGNISVVDVSSINCDLGGNFSSTFTLILSNPLEGGADYTVDIAPTAVFEMLDLCGNSAIPTNFSFTTDFGFNVDLGPDQTLCAGETLLLDATTPDASYIWQDGSIAPTFLVDEAGTYFVTVSSSCGMVSDTVEVGLITDDLEVALGNDTTICFGESLVLEVNQPGANIEWQDGSTAPTFEVTQPGLYAVEVAVDCAAGGDSIIVSFAQSIEAMLTEEELCPGESITWDVTTEGATYLWQDGSVDPTFTTSVDGVFSVIITTGCDEQELMTEVILLEEPPADLLDMDTTLCAGEAIVYDFNLQNTSFQWQDGSDATSYSISESGTYALTVSNSCGTVEDMQVIAFIDSITTTLSSGGICEGDTIIWDVTTPLASYLWQDGSTDPTFVVAEAGNYSVTITNPCDTVVLNADMEVVSLLPEDLLTNDTTLCPEESLTFEFNFPAAEYLWQDSTTDNFYVVDTTGIYSLRVSNSCGEVKDTMDVDFIEPIILDLVTDTFLCPNEFYPIDAFSPSATFYQWQDNSTDTLYFAIGPGQYSVTAGNKCESVKVDINITECEICDVYIPNVFSPNGDGYNDIFQPLSDCILEAYQVQIFDRWGALIFESTDPEVGWNGKINDQLVNHGVFIWMMSYVVIENNMPRAVSRSGDIAVIY